MKILPLTLISTVLIPFVLQGNALKNSIQSADAIVSVKLYEDVNASARENAAKRVIASSGGGAWGSQEYVVEKVFKGSIPADETLKVHQLVFPLGKSVLFLVRHPFRDQLVLLGDRERINKGWDKRKPWRAKNMLTYGQIEWSKETESEIVDQVGMLNTPSALLTSVDPAALTREAKPKIFEEIHLRFGDIYEAQDYGVYINDERIKGQLYDTLEGYSELSVLSVIVEDGPRVRYNRGYLNKHDLFEVPTFGERTLKEGEIRKLLFVRAPVTRTEAWAKVKEYILHQELNMDDYIFQGITFLHREEIHRYRWHFTFPRKHTSGKLTISFDVLTHEITHGTAP